MNFIFSYAHAQIDSVFDLMLSSEQGLYFRWTKFLMIIWNTPKSSKLYFTYTIDHVQ